MGLSVFLIVLPEQSAFGVGDYIIAVCTVGFFGNGLFPCGSTVRRLKFSLFRKLQTCGSLSAYCRSKVKSVKQGIIILNACDLCCHCAVYPSVHRGHHIAYCIGSVHGYSSFLISVFVKSIIHQYPAECKCLFFIISYAPKAYSLCQTF